MNVVHQDAYEVALGQLDAGNYVVQFPVRAFDDGEWWDCVATYSMPFGEFTGVFLHHDDPMIRARFLILATAQARRHTRRQAESEGQLLQL